MVRILLVAASFASAPAAAATLRAQLDTATVALGEPLTLSVTATGGALDALDLTPLARQFELGARTLNRGADGDTLTVRLYARAAGALDVPALHAGAANTRPLAVTVLDGSDAVPRVAATWTLQPAHPFVNEPARLSLSICDDGSLQWSRPSLPLAAGRVVQARGEAQQADRRDGVVCTVQRYDWSLVATRPGAFAVGASMIGAMHFGRSLRFPVPDLAYTVQPLPAWLPREVPPVEPTIVARSTPRSGTLGRPVSWTFSVTGGYSAETLASLIGRQLRDTDDYRVYPVAVAPAELDDPASPLARFDVTLHVEPRRRGVLQLPVVRLPWYDTGRGILAGAALRPTAVRVDDPRLRALGWSAGGAAGGLLFGLVAWQTRRSLRWRRARRDGLGRIVRAPTLDALDAAVRAFSVSGRPAAPSLGAWLRTRGRDVDARAVAPLIARLEHAQFGRTSPDSGTAGDTLATLRQAFVDALKTARPRR